MRKFYIQCDPPQDVVYVKNTTNLKQHLQSSRPEIHTKVRMQTELFLASWFIRAKFKLRGFQ